MPRTAQLNWEPSRGKWKVVYRGTKYRFDGGTGKSDREAKKKADAAWKVIKAEADLAAERAKPHRAEYESVIAEWTAVLTWSVDHGDETMAAVAREKLQDLEARLSLPTPSHLTWADRFPPGPDPLPPGSPASTEALGNVDPCWQTSNLDKPDDYHAANQPLTFSGPSPHDPIRWKDRLEAQERRLDLTGTDVTFASNVAKFIESKRNEANAGQLSVSRPNTLKIHLDMAMEFTGTTTSVANIDARTLTGFRQHLLSRVSANQMKVKYASDVFASFKSFVRWLAENTEHLEHLPKNISSKSLKISVDQRTPEILNPDRIRELLRAANDRTRLYLLLGANCAMTQKDMSDLHPREVNWSRGTITRKRSKTKEWEDVPTVTYRLWPWTLELLKAERSQDEHRVLLTREGRPLTSDRMTPSGTYRKTDAVRLAVRRLAQKTGISFTLKALKKTSVSLLADDARYASLKHLFLGHSPKSIADKHYVRPTQKLLNEGIDWLGDQLGIKEPLPDSEDDA